MRLNNSISHEKNLFHSEPRPFFQVIFDVPSIMLDTQWTKVPIKSWLVRNEDKFIWPGADNLFYGLVWSNSGVILQGRISCLHERPCWLHALVAIQQRSPLFRKFYPSEDWLSSRCLTSVIARELVFPSWHQMLTSYQCYQKITCRNWMKYKKY